MTRTPRAVRTLARAVHLVVAVVLGTYVYLPPDLAGGLRAPLMLVGVPLATVTGIVMWQQAAIRRLVTRATAGGHPREAGGRGR